MDKCYAFLVTAMNKWINEEGGSPYSLGAGYGNGYVAVPPGHPLHGLHYDAVDVDVHGGLTLANGTEFIYENPMIKREDIEFLDGEVPEGYWIFGFDTCHAFDSLESWPRERVIGETMRLKNALELLATTREETMVLDKSAFKIHNS
jgi:hypothetical protein